MLPARSPAKCSRVSRDLHGVVLLDKPEGLSSNQALQCVKRLFGAAKAGHTGSLDPLATGMLPICFGEATKLTGFMLGADKTYEVTALLGVATETGDAEGAVVSELPVPELSAAGVRAVLESFSGEIEQVPPMFSALKQGGQRLYSLARRGIEVERAPRLVRIYEISLLELRSSELRLRVKCSKGTYIRTLVEDIARGLDTVGHVAALRRTAVAPFEQQPMVTLEAMEARSASAPEVLDEYLLPVDAAIADWPRLVVDSVLARRLTQGQAVQAQADWPEAQVRLYSPAQRFFGIGEVLPARRLVPRRIFPGLSPWS